MGEGRLEAEGIAELFLEGAFPGGGAVPVTATAVSKDEDAVGIGIAVAAFVVPPPGKGIAREVGCVVRGWSLTGLAALAHLAPRS